MKDKQKVKYIKGRYYFWFIPLILSFIVFFSAKWYINTYGQIGCDAILFTLLSDIHGTDPGIIMQYILQALIPGILTAFLVWFVLFFRNKHPFILHIKKININIYPFKNYISRIVAVVLCLCFTCNACYIAGVFEYIKIITKGTKIYEQEYVDPDSVNIVFPDKKQNLIYIYAESLEATLFSKENGGARDVDIIPELYELAENNTNFSLNEWPGGARSLYGATWTAGAMVAQSAGIPLKLPKGIGGNGYGKCEKFLPGVTTLSDILHENGYYQALMMGSDSSFAGTNKYFTQHGVDKVYDYNTAPEDGIIPKGYKVWWGFEDKKLFRYAEQELTEMAKKDQPFALTMFTIDTHFPDGYVCDLCDNKFENQYDNVYACSGRQICNFIKWVQNQDFGPDTTIIICGDHPTMDKRYIKKTVPDNFVRTVYNCFVNPLATASDCRNRQFSTMDMFPSTLAALGCEIEGDRLGLGTNLFSDKKTLEERSSYQFVNTELLGASDYYSSHFQ